LATLLGTLGSKAKIARNLQNEFPNQSRYPAYVITTGACGHPETPPAVSSQYMREPVRAPVRTSAPTPIPTPVKAKPYNPFEIHEEDKYPKDVLVKTRNPSPPRSRTTIEALITTWRASGPLGGEIRDESFLCGRLGDPALPQPVSDCPIFHPSNIPFFHVAELMLRDDLGTAALQSH